jgi:hypothetical protein
MSALLVGYARRSTDQQDLTAQRDGLLGLGVEAERIYVDHGLTGTNRERPGLRKALAACRAGDTLVVTKLDRLARSLPDARAIADELTARQISPSREREADLPRRRSRGYSEPTFLCSRRRAVGRPPEYGASRHGLAGRQLAGHTGPVTELLRVPLRAVGVGLPAIVLLGIDELRGGGQDDGYGVFLGAMALTLLAAALWSAVDAHRAPFARVIIRWIATAVVASAGLGISATMMPPASPSEAVGTSVFFLVPLLMATGVGVAIGAVSRAAPRKIAE